MEANSTGGQGSRRAVAPSDDDDVVKMNGPHREDRKKVSGLRLFLGSDNSLISTWLGI